MEGNSPGYSGSDLNTAVGNTALANINGGDRNLALGSKAGFNITTGSNNIIIGGNSLDAPSATANNQLNIGNIIYGTNIDGTGAILSTGNIGIGTTSPQDKLHVEGNIRMVDGNQAEGKVMASNVDGSATWEDPASVATATTYYGEMYEYNARGSSSTINISAQDVYHGWITASAGEFNSSGVIIANNTVADRLVVLQNGYYLVNISLSFSSNTNGDIIDGAVFHNDARQDDMSFRRKMAIQDVAAPSISGIIQLTAGDYLDLRFTADDDAILYLNMCNFSIVRIR